MHKNILFESEMMGGIRAPSLDVLYEKGLNQIVFYLLNLTHSGEMTHLTFILILLGLIVLGAAVVFFKRKSIYITIP